MCVCVCACVRACVRAWERGERDTHTRTHAPHPTPTNVQIWLRYLTLKMTENSKPLLCDCDSSTFHLLTYTTVCANSINSSSSSSSSFFFFPPPPPPLSLSLSHLSFRQKARIISFLLRRQLFITSEVSDAPEEPETSDNLFPCGVLPFLGELEGSNFLGKRSQLGPRSLITWTSLENIPEH